MSVITNLYTDPSCHKQLNTWASSGGVNVESLAGGRYRYTHADNGTWSLSNLQKWSELMRSGRVVVVAYTATSGLNVEIESGTPLASGTTPSGATWKAAKTVGGRQPQHHLPWRGQFDVGGLGRVRGRRMADRPTIPPPVPVVRRRLDAPAVIGGERR